MNNLKRLSIKIFKFLAYSLIVLVAFLFLLNLVIALLLYVPELQKRALRTVSKHISEFYGVDVELSAVRISIPFRIKLIGIVIYDYKKNPMIRIPYLSVPITGYSLKKDVHLLSIGDIRLQEPDITIIKYKGDTLFNIEEFLKHFETKEKDTQKATPFKLNVNNLIIKDGSFTFSMDGEKYMRLSFPEIQLKNFSYDTSLIEGKLFIATRVMDTLESPPKLTINLKFKQSSSSLQIDTLSVKSDSSYVFIHGNFKPNYVDIKLDELSIAIQDIVSFKKSLAKSLNIYLDTFSEDILQRLNGKSIKAYASILFNKPSIRVDSLVAYLEDVFYLDAQGQIDENMTGKIAMRRFFCAPNFFAFINPEFANINSFYADATISTERIEDRNYKKIAFRGNLNLQTRGGKVVLKSSSLLDTSLNPEKISIALTTDTLQINRIYSKKDLPAIASRISLQFAGNFHNNISSSHLSDYLESANLYLSIPYLKYHPIYISNASLSAEKQGRNAKVFFGIHDSHIDASSQMHFALKSDSIHNLHLEVSLNNLFLPFFIQDTSLQINTLKGQLQSDVSSLDVKNIKSKISFTNWEIETRSGKLNMPSQEFAFTTKYKNKNQIAIDLRALGNLLELEAQTTFNAETFAQDLQKYLKSILLSESPIKDELNSKKLTQKYVTYNDFSIKIKGKLSFMDMLPSITQIPLTQKNFFLEANIDPKQEISTFSLSADEITYEKNTLSKFSLTGKISQNSVNAELSISELSSDAISLKNIKVLANQSKNWGDLTILVGNSSDTNTFFCNFSSIYHIQDSLFSFYIKPSVFYLLNKEWQIFSQDTLKKTPSIFSPGIIKISSEIANISINGAIAPNYDTSLIIRIERLPLKISNLFVPESLLTIGGFLSSTINIKQYPHLIVNADASIKDLDILNYQIGSGTINALYDFENKSGNINSNFYHNDKQTLYITGSINNETNLFVNASLNNFPLSIVHPYVKDFISTFDGFADISINLTGTTSKITPTGEISLYDVKLRMPQIGETYKVKSGKILINSSTYTIESITLMDMSQNTSTLTGSINHLNFIPISYKISINSNKFTYLNTTPHENNFFYGKAILSGDVAIEGDLQKMIVKVYGKVLKNTEINMNMSSPTEVEELAFIKYRKPAKSSESIVLVEKDTTPPFNFILQMDLEITPQSLVKIIFDEKAGDIMKANGQANLSINFSLSGNLSIEGTYEITSGDYLFTFRNLVNKKFYLKPGGTITFAGNPYNATMNIQAVYKTDASLYDLVLDSTLRTPVPVECILKMTGTLSKPIISFDIDLPKSDENTKIMVRSNMPTEEEITKQVVSLLLLNKFFTPSYMKTGIVEKKGGVGGTGAPIEMLTNQLSNWLSSISKDVSIGLNYKPGDEITSDKLDLAFKTQLFNERMIIKTNIGILTQSQNNNLQQNTSQQSSVMGDVDIEYLLTPDGKWKTKFFSYTQSMTGQTGTIQGLGLSYSKNFNSYKELFRKKKTK